MKTFSVSINDLKFGKRLVPSFYYYSKIVKNENTKKGISYIRLGDCSIISDGEHSHIPRNSKEGVRYLYGRNIKEGIVDFDPISDNSFITVNDYTSFKRCHLKENDVLIAIYGTIGKSAVYKSQYIGQAGIPRHISSITLKKDALITPEYLTSFFRSKVGKWQLFSVTTGNIQQLLSLKNLREFSVPVISDSLMTEITKYESDAINCEIMALSKIKEAQELFYKGLNFDVNSIEKEFTFNVKISELKDSNIWSSNFYNRLFVNMADALERHNGIRTLRELVDTSKGDEVGSGNYIQFLERNDQDKPFIRTSDIVNNEVDLYPDYYIPQEALEEIEQDLKPGDIIFTKDGKVGCVAMITEEDNVILSSGVVRFRIKANALVEGFTPEYIFTALSVREVGLYGALRRTVVASTIPHLREDRMKDIEIPIQTSENVNKITKLIREAFVLKAKRKELLKKSVAILEDVL